jgi:hypothetical protein
VNTTLTRYIEILAVGVITGLGGGWLLWHPKPAAVETYATAQRQADSSLVLERKPDATAKPAQQIPKGGTVERVVQVTVQPKPVPSSEVYPLVSNGLPVSTDSGAKSTPDVSSPMSKSDSLICPPVRVDLSLVRMKDQTRRVIASSPDGAVVGGVDIPVENATPQKVLKWAAGPVYTNQRTWGAFIDRDLGPLRLGVSGYQQRIDSVATRNSWAAEVRVGLRF